MYGTYFGISPYRFDPTEVGTFFGNEAIDTGINLQDRAEFYVPWVMNRGNVDQMFLGTYRLYRTDNAEAASAADVLWKPISPDLTAAARAARPTAPAAASSRPSASPTAATASTPARSTAGSTSAPTR